MMEVGGDYGVVVESIPGANGLVKEKYREVGSLECVRTGS
jgi:hypothetical protein